MKSSGLSLYTYLGVIIVSVVVVVVTSYSALTYFTAKSEIMDNLRQHSEEIISGLQKNIGTYIEAYAVNEYDMLIQTEMDSPDLLAIVISDHNMGEVLGTDQYVSGKIRDAEWNIVDYDPENSRHVRMLEECFYPVTSDIRSESGRHMGSLTVCSSDRSIEKALQRIVYGNVVYTSTISLLLVTLLFFTIRRIVLGPVAEIVEKLRKGGDSPLPQADMPEGGPQEISILGIAINRMIEAIHDREAELQQSESRFRSLVENMPAMVFLKRADDLRFELLNSAGERLLGYSRNDLLGKGDHDFFGKEQADAFTAGDREVLAGHSVVEIPEEPITTRDGSIKFLQTFKTGLYDAKGRPTHLLGIAVDITEKKRMEARARMLTQAIEQSGEAILITDGDGKTEFVNGAFCKLTGYTEEEVSGRTPRFLESGRHAAAFYEEMWKSLVSQGAWQGKIQNRKKDGSVYPALLTISAIQNERGETIQYIGIQQDLTEFEELEEKFHQAQKMEAIGTLVGGIAHDFNNMLAGITGNVYLAKRDVEEGSGLAGKLDVIEKLSFRAAEMIKQLMAFSRKQHAEMSTISIGSFLKEILKLHRVSVPENIALNSAIQDPSVLVVGDVTQLQQVVLNLVNNARDALEGVADPVIDISMVELEADEDFMRHHAGLSGSHLARITVKDNGCGIPAEHLEQIFEPFFTTKGVGKGTGLGLSQVYGVIATHGGVVEAESQVGVGTSIHLYLPVVEQAVQPDSREAEPLSSDEHAHGETLLLADDDDAVRISAGEVLRSLGYHVLTAANGREAVELFEAHPEIDLLIFDVVMPEMGGMEALQEIRKKAPGIKVIFSTGYASSEKIRATGNVEVLYKPFQPHVLAQIIRKVLT